MIFISALHYYTSSLITLATYTNFWDIPLALVSQPIIKTSSGLRLEVASVQDAWAIKEVVLDNDYQLDTSAKYQTILDIGTGIGEFAVLASPYANQVIGYEPDEKRAGLSRKNALLNDRKNITIHTSPAPSIDQILKDNHLKHIDLLKIDCEGCEYDIFINSSDKAIKKINTITAELHMFDEDMMKENQSLKFRLTKLGYKVGTRPNPVHKTIEFFYAKK